MCDLCDLCDFLIRESKWPPIVFLSSQCDKVTSKTSLKKIYIQKIKDCNICDSYNLCDFIIRESKWSLIDLTNLSK